MLRWCSFCQKFMGESKPFDDFSWTDGICTSCKTDFENNKQAKTADFKKRLTFFRSLRTRAIEGQSIDHHAVVTEATHLGIDAADVLIGILQPILYEIGNLFAQNKISTIEEHRFSALTEKILDHFENEMPIKLKSSKVQVVLASADQNYHTIGIRMLTLLLQKEGLRVRSVVPSVPAADLVKLCKEIKPNALGISVFLDKQIEYVKEVFDALGADRPKLIAVGGSLNKSDALRLDSSIYTPNTRNIQDVVERIKLACAKPAKRQAA